MHGDVYTLANNENLIVKVPRYFVKKHGMLSHGRRNYLDSISQYGIKDEAELYQNNGLENEPLFIPTKIVNIGKGCPSDQCEYMELIRPRVAPILGRKKGTIRRGVGKLTDSQLLELRNKLIDLSNKGYTFWDGLQLGVDASGRVLAYDVGSVSMYPLSDRATTFRVNNGAWFQFLENIGRDTDYERFGGALT